MRIQVRTDRGDGPVLVDDVSLTLNRGEVIGLIGESGAGKSTIGLASMGYTRRDCFIVGGEIVLNGKDVRKMSADERRRLRGPRISYIAQSAAASFNPAMTLMDQVCEASIRHGVLKPAEARAEAISLFKQLDLPDPMNIGDRYPHQVSGGQLQRAMAAMAMVARPDIVVFDEPTTALDVTTQVEMPGGVPQIDPRARRRRAVYHRTTSRSSRRSPIASWCSGAARWSNSARRGKSSRRRRRNTLAGS